MFEIQKWPKEVPKEFCWKAMENFQRQKIRDIKATKDYHNGLDNLKDEYLNRLHEIVGGDKLKRYQKLHNARLHQLRTAAKTFPDTPEKMQEREALRLHLVKESQKTIDKSGIKLKKVNKLRDSYLKKVDKLFERTIGKGKLGKATTKKKNTDYEPPYWLVDERVHDHYESEDSLPDPSYTLHFHDRTGDFGSDSRINVSGADEWDLVSMTCRSGFILFYYNSHVGLPQFNFDLETINLYYQGFIRNEAGCSSASVLQMARLFAQVYGAGGETERTYCPTYLAYNHRNSREDSWSETVLPPGTDLSLSFVLPTPMPADTWVFFGVGIETYNRFLSNDCEVDCTIEARFLARNFGITTTT